MIHFWVREILGWVLVLLGLYVFLISLAILLRSNPSILEAPAIVLIGIIIFRGGIHLLKVAVAARVSMQAQAEVRKEVETKSAKNADMPWDW